jgi:DNA-binding MarR family transcriptional regulator/N-acetylglutamate synthase-like GNAT family acetyltransferase
MEQQRIAVIRGFNRFYTQKIGVLQDKFLDSAFSLTEGRVIYELLHREATTAADLSLTLGLDPGYLSRILRSFVKRGLIDRKQSETDGRERTLSLTAEGQKAYAPLDVRANEQIGMLVRDLSVPQQIRLTKAMKVIQDLLSPESTDPAHYLVRAHRPGDMGWVVARHGALYAEEYGWDQEFEALAAEITAKFIRHYDPKWDRCWIAERNGESVGCVFLVKQSKTVAKLRLLLVEPKARGLGIGARLVNECITFARQAGYRKIVLWTQSMLQPARDLYKKAGFTLVAEEPHHSFGKSLVGETWELAL